MGQDDKARAFAALHVKGEPLILYNIWDAGSAKAVAAAGAKALATGSGAVAAAQGFSDGEKIPLELLATIVKRIGEAVDLPLSVDFEGAYARDPAGAAENVGRIIEAGAIGINFEDQIIGGDGLYSVEEQVARIAAIRGAAEKAGVPLFINARTDLFLKEPDRSRHTSLLPETKARAKAYAEAGASGFFAPALVDEGLIEELCAATELPVNIIAVKDAPDAKRLGALGVARISHGPFPYRAAMQRLQEAAAEFLG